MDEINAVGEAPVKTWRHVRKGPLTGRIVDTDLGEFVVIELTEDARSYDAGEQVTVRRSFLTEVP